MRPFKNIDEQINILIDRGLLIEDYNKAKRYLIHNNYYNVVNMYSKLFQEKENLYINGTTFEEIKALHIFDTEIKNLLMKYIIIAEKHFKSIFAYHFAKKYHNKPFAYLDTSNYSNSNPLALTQTLSYISKKVNEQIRSKKENSVKHHFDNHKDVPIWVIVNDLTLGNIIKLYKFIDNKTRNEIAKELSDILDTNIHQKINLEPNYLDKILDNVLNVRNCVAHNNKLLKYKCNNNIKFIPALYGSLEIDSKSSRQTPFHVFIALKCFLPTEDYALLHNSILKRTNNMSKKLNDNSMDLVLESYGFPLSWHKKVSKIPQK